MAPKSKASNGHSMKSLRPEKHIIENLEINTPCSRSASGSTWTTEDDVRLIRAVECSGLSWNRVKKLFPARNGNPVELRYNQFLRKSNVCVSKSSMMVTDSVTD